MRTIRLMAVVAAAMLIMACSKSTTNTNSNTSRPANTNTQTKTATSSATSSAGKKAVTPVSTTASGENVFTHEEGGIQFEAPPTWKAEADGDTITVSAPDNSVAVVFTVVDGADLEHAATAIGSELQKVMKDVEVDGPEEEGTHNGMKVYSQKGKAEVNGNDIIWSCSLIAAKKPVLVYGFAAPGLYEQHQADINKLVQSVKPAS